HRPTLLLADEPTGNLDTATGQRVLELLLSLPRQYGTTLLMVTHSREVAEGAGRTVFLENGRLREGSL
ncbi:MAG: ABC transporter ATP-binding protein, partial [Candidatus Competibacteraceae bacterium]|nr:ABC transporter ATP-binding protein [Candidatus Competibacteraceae bacterium]